MVTVKRLAASILGVGESRIRVLDAKKAGEALTRDDLRGLIEKKLVVAVQKKGVGRAKAAQRAARKRAGRRGGRGSRKGSRAVEKILWAGKIRAQRKFLSAVRPRLGRAYRRVYLMMKGNAFRDVGALKAFLAENKLLK